MCPLYISHDSNIKIFYEKLLCQSDSLHLFAIINDTILYVYVSEMDFSWIPWSINFIDCLPLLPERLLPERRMFKPKLIFFKFYPRKGKSTKEALRTPKLCGVMIFLSKEIWRYLGQNRINGKFCKITDHDL